MSSIVIFGESRNGCSSAVVPPSAMFVVLGFIQWIDDVAERIIVDLLLGNNGSCFFFTRF